MTSKQDCGNASILLPPWKRHVRRMKQQKLEQRVRKANETDPRFDHLPAWKVKVLRQREAKEKKPKAQQPQQSFRRDRSSSVGKRLSKTDPLTSKSDGGTSGKENKKHERTASKSMSLSPFNSRKTVFEQDRSLQRRIERVLQSRMFLLHQSGHKAFLIGTEKDPQQRFKVILGPQTCSCNNTKYRLCNHLLFVMLRILKVPRDDPILSQKTLQEFEVESLLVDFVGHSRGYRPGPLRIHSKNDDCPICWSEMVKDSEEKLFECDQCHNLVHDQCMSVWADAQLQQTGKVGCCICRQTLYYDAKEPTTTVTSSLGHTDSCNGHIYDPVVDSLTPSHHVPSLPDPDEPLLLPVTAPLSSEIISLKKDWIVAYGEQVISCIFSREWATREIAMKWLYRKLAETPLNGNSEKLAATIEIVSHVLKDPVLKVYNAALLSVPLMLSWPNMKKAMLISVFDNIIIKCGNANSRAREKSLSAITEMVQEERSFEFVMFCACKATQTSGFEWTENKSLSWRWWLGRLCLVLRLMDLYPNRFIKSHVDARHENSSDAESVKAKHKVESHIEIASALAAGGEKLTHLRVTRTATALLNKLQELKTRAGFLASHDQDRFSDHLAALQAIEQDEADCHAIAYAADVREQVLEDKSGPKGDGDKENCAAAANVTTKCCTGIAATVREELLNDTYLIKSKIEKSSNVVVTPDDIITTPLYGEDLAVTISKDYKEGIHWRKGQVLGTGAFSTAFCAQDVATGALMAVKQISFCSNTVEAEQKMLQSIQHEINVMRSLEPSEQCVKYYGASSEENHLNIFMEHIGGGSLSSMVSRFGPMTGDRHRRSTHQILLGLQHLHSKGVIHRDVKGANVLVDSSGLNMKLCDFGAAAILSKLKTISGEFKSTHGTAAYMSPEVIRGEPYGRKADIWSLGCTCLEMATGKPPWSEEDYDNHFALMFKIGSTNDLPHIPDTVEGLARDFILKCLTRCHEKRPTTEELLEHPFITGKVRPVCSSVV